MKQIEYNFWKYSSKDTPLDIITVGETFCDKDYKIRRSDSDLHSFEYILDGKGYLDINGQHLVPQKNDIFLLTEKSSHCYYADKDEPWHKIYIIFRGRMADELIKCYLPENVHLFKNCDIEYIFKSILKIAANPLFTYPQKVDLITLELIKIFSYLRNRNAVMNTDLADEIKQKLDYYIDKPFNMDILCKDLNYSKNHIINIFKSKYKMTPYAYYNKKRTDAAKYYLRNTQLSIKSIAQTLAYTDTHYFSNCFKKETGLTPVEYRNEINISEN